LPLDPGAARLLRMLGASAPVDQDAPATEARRLTIERLSRVAGGGAGPAVVTRDLQAAGPAGSIPLRLYASAAPCSGALVWLHGGGWVAGGLDSHDPLCRRLAASSGVSVIAVDYRLAPEHRFPAAFEDALAAVRWVAEHAGSLGLAAGKLAVGGDSVGAGLAAAVALSADAPPLVLQVLLCPVLDVVHERPSRRLFRHGFFMDPKTFSRDLDDYCGPGVDRTDPRLSPLLARHLGREPPALIHAAECDPFRDEACAYADRLCDVGVGARFVLWPGMIHYFYLLVGAIPAAAPAVETLGAELREALA